MMITAEMLRAVMAQAGARADAFAQPITDACDRFVINTPARQAAFLAQIGHESGQLRYVREIWGPTDAQKRYEGRADLGNTEPGDGKRFMGRGLIQITGRRNYVQCGFGLHLDLTAHPELLETPENAAASAAWFWHTHNLNQYADNGDFETLTRRINGGLNGLADRISLWEKAKHVMNAGTN